MTHKQFYRVRSSLTAPDSLVYFQKYALKQDIQNSSVVYMVLRMASPTKSANGVYCYIVRVPVDQIRVLGRNRIKESLRTKDPLEAKKCDLPNRNLERWSDLP
ncbi:MAG: hypothetical protein ACI9KK_002948 [Ascidiaceihabitans sp.]|jgi:hypothetical protein